MAHAAVRRWLEWSAKHVPLTPPDRQSVFLISGGARGITARCVIHMAQHYRCTFILLGRSELPPSEPEWARDCTDPTALKQRIAADLTAHGEKAAPARIQQIFNALVAGREIRQTLDAIQAAGGHAYYLSADVTELARLRAHLSDLTAATGPITGILHGAGTLADKLIEAKTAQDFDRVYAAKVEGLHNLLACVPAEQLRHLILFSSAAGFYGNIGQSDYALANEVLNKFAHAFHRRHPNCHVLSFNWGPWDGGMVTPALKQLFARRRIEVIPIDAGTQILVNELDAANPETVQVLVGSPMGQPAALPDEPLRPRRVQRHLSLEQNPFLYDHMIGEHAVLPTTFAMAWMANTCEQLAPGLTFFRCEQFRVLKGIVFDETLSGTYTLEVQEFARNREVGSLLLAARIASTTPEGRPRYHYSGQIELRTALPPPPMLHANRVEAEAFDGARCYQDGTLFHGPLFQGIERVLRLTNDGLTLRVRCPLVTLAQQGQFAVQSLDPLLFDIQLQSTLIWVRHFFQAASLPLSLGAGEQYRLVRPGEILYVTLEPRISQTHSFSADITTSDEDGAVVARMEAAEVTISPQLNRLFARAVS